LQYVTIQIDVIPYFYRSLEPRITFNQVYFQNYINTQMVSTVRRS